MTTVPPKSFRLTALPRSGEPGKFDVIYDEEFDDADLVKRTVGLMQPTAKLRSNVKAYAPSSKVIRIEIDAATLEQLSNMMMCEFIQWAPLGKLTLAQFVLTTAVSMQPQV